MRNDTTIGQTPVEGYLPVASLEHRLKRPRTAIFMIQIDALVYFHKIVHRLISMMAKSSEAKLIGAPRKHTLSSGD